MQRAREDYYQENCLCFDCKTSCNMADIFQSMIESTSLLSSEIYKIKETWTGQRKLQYANYALRTLPKGLKFFCPVSPSESPKVMGLTGIHHPDALHHFNVVTHCLWCGKEGQNEGTIVNHLWMMHYKLGLVCKKCFCCPLVTSKAIWHHGQKSCQLSVEGDPYESSLSAQPQVQGMPDQHSKEGDLDGGSGGGSDIHQTATLGISAAPSAWTWMGVRHLSN